MTRKEYSIRGEKSGMIFYDISDGDHKLQVNPGDGEKQGGDYGIFAIDNDWWSTYYIARDMGLIK